VSYQGSAFLMGYYAGVTQALLEKKVLVSASYWPGCGCSCCGSSLVAAQRTRDLVALV
jgi:hypothetical protein